MAAKVGPMESEHQPQQLGKDDDKGSSASIRHHDEATDFEYNNEVTWIKDHIKMRKCSYYMPSGEKSMCQCGYDKNDKNGHELFAFSRQKRDVESNATKLEWDFQKHSVTEPTDAFGEIKFVGFRGNIGKFVRVDRQTDMQTMLNLMMKVWRIKMPNLVISVTGEANNFNTTLQMRDMIQRGIVKVLHSTGAWIITAGCHTGVIKHVGEAFKKYRLTSSYHKDCVAIGIASWGVIQKRDALINKEGSWPADYRIKGDLNTNGIFLDPNHSHFILVDNGTHNKFSTEIPFRAELEQKISEMKTGTGNDAVSVPIVILVLEGGPGTLETVQNALMHNTPVVIVQGSGRAADILSYAFKYAETVEVDAKDKQRASIIIAEKHLSPNLEAEIHKQMIEMKFCPKQDIAFNMQRIKYCLGKSELIHIFEWDSDVGAQDMEVAMLKAAMKANKNNVIDQLKLALAWNKIEIAKGLMFTAEKSLMTFSLRDIMLSAIQRDRVDFVELFLDNGFDLKMFLTINRLLLLYDNAFIQVFFKPDRLRWMAVKHKQQAPDGWLRRSSHNRIKSRIALGDVKLLLEHLLDDSNIQFIGYDDNVITDITEAKGSNGQIEETSNSPFVHDPISLHKIVYLNGSDAPAGDNPCLHLFIWSILSNRQDMAKLFWRHGKDATATALLAHVLLSSMSRKTDDTDLKEQCEKHGRQFLDLAVGILKEAYSKDPGKTRDLLIQELSQWNQVSRLQIALKSKCDQFISLPACQDLFNSIWMGALRQDASMLTLLVCVICPLFIPLSDTLKLDEVDTHTIDDHTTKSSVQIEVYTPPKRENTCLNFKKFSAFYQAPVIIFVHNVISYMVFLCLYSYILISKLEEKISSEEILLIVWVFTIFTEEIRQVNTSASGTFRTKFLRYLKDGWNKIDVIAILLFIFGMVLRSIPHPHAFDAARIFFGLDLVTFFIRLLHIFTVHKELGPKLVMIIRTVRSMFYFFLILLVFIVAYAIASFAILYPKTELSLDTLIAIFRRPYWNIYGELMLDEIEGAADCTNNAELYGNGTHPRCPTESGKYVVPVLMGVYMLMCNILLLNLLIVMFGYTFQMVQDNIDMHWNLQLHDLICDYFNRPFLAPPLIIFVHFFYLIKFIFRKCTFGCSTDPSLVAYSNHVENEHELREWEAVIADTFCRKRDLADIETSDYRFKTTASRLDELAIKFDQLQAQLKVGKVTMEDAHSRPIQSIFLSEQNLYTGTESGSTNLDRRMKNMEKQLQWIVNSLNEHQLRTKRDNPDVTDVRVNEKKQKTKKGGETSTIVFDMLERHVKVHTQSRTSLYPGSNIHRFEVPNDKVSWDVDFPEYDPPTYISHELLQNPDWADKVDLYQIPVVQRSMVLRFNSVDLVTKTSRVSYAGNYQLLNGIPMNPIGRTGLVNRGRLGRWGPNHVVDPVITRWKYDETGLKIMDDGKPVFEFVAVKIQDSGIWALPESILAPGRRPTKNLKIKFSEEALGALGEDSLQKTKFKRQMKKLLRKGELIYQGYADDPRNTDNAWVESTVYLYQDENDILRHFSLTFDAGHPAIWLAASSKVSFYDGHSGFIKLVAERLDASY